MRVRITSSLIGEDGQEWHTDEIRDVSEGFARYLIGRGAARLVGAGELPPAPALTTAAINGPDPVPVHRDPPRRKK